MLCDIEGDYTVRFMTSHPKDATRELFDTIAKCGRISRHIHLPVQSGSDAVLAKMNRGYTADEYLSLIEYALEKIDGVSFSSDIIVGFPGETESDFEATMALVEKVRYNSLFTFIYSRREGTPAAGLDDATPHKLKTDRLAGLIELQDKISREIFGGYVGGRKRVLVTDIADDERYAARLDDNSEITLEGAGCDINTYVMCKITEINKKRLMGKVIQKDEQ